MEKKIKWGDKTLEYSRKNTGVISVLFHDVDGSASGQYEFEDSVAFSTAYCTNSILRGLVGGYDRFHQFKRLTGLTRTLFDVRDTLERLLDKDMPFGGMTHIGRASRILKLISTGEGAIALAMSVICAVKATGDKAAVIESEYAYGEAAVSLVLELCEYDGASHQDLSSIMVDILSRGAVPGYNWKNYRMLSDAGLIHQLSNYDDDGRGDILKVHSVNGEYDIIQVRAHGSMLDAYYPVGSRDDSASFDEFDACLLHMMFPRFYDSVVTLYKVEGLE